MTLGGTAFRGLSLPLFIIPIRRGASRTLRRTGFGKLTDYYARLRDGCERAGIPV